MKEHDLCLEEYIQGIENGTIPIPGEAGEEAEPAPEEEETAESEVEEVPEEEPAEEEPSEEVPEEEEPAEEPAEEEYAGEYEDL